MNVRGIESSRFHVKVNIGCHLLAALATLIIGRPVTWRF
jgi:hypothetical protein